MGSGCKQLLPHVTYSTDFLSTSGIYPIRNLDPNRYPALVYTSIVLNFTVAGEQIPFRFPIQFSVHDSSTEFSCAYRSCPSAMSTALTHSSCLTSPTPHPLDASNSDEGLKIQTTRMHLPRLRYCFRAWSRRDGAGGQPSLRTERLLDVLFLRLAVPRGPTVKRGTGAAGHTGSLHLCALGRGIRKQFGLLHAPRRGGGRSLRVCVRHTS